jgi:hypothetical protein
MNAEVVRSEQINRESIDLNIVRIDEIIDNPDKLKEVNLDEKHKVEILAEAIMREEASEFKRTRAIQKARKDSCCYRWCNFTCTDDDD